ADFQACWLAGVFLVLRHAAHRAEAVERIVPADGRMAVDDAVRPHDRAAADADVVADDAVGAHADIFGQLRRRGYDGGWMNAFGRHQLSSTTRMAHMILASATTSPSTVALAVYLHITRLMRSASTSSRNWSPGTTGL